MAAAAAVDDSTICASSRHTRHHRTRVSGVGTTCAQGLPMQCSAGGVLEPRTPTLEILKHLFSVKDSKAWRPAHGANSVCYSSEFNLIAERRPKNGSAAWQARLLV